MKYKEINKSFGALTAVAIKIKAFNMTLDFLSQLGTRLDNNEKVHESNQVTLKFLGSNIS